MYFENLRKTSFDQPVTVLHNFSAKPFGFLKFSNTQQFSVLFLSVGLSSFESGVKSRVCKNLMYDNLL
jgi:hypothetical protein